MKKYILFTSFLAVAPLMFGQSNDRGGMKVTEDFPKENLFVHFNTSLLFSGEYLYYKVYSINTDTEDQSEISKIAYVELVGEDGGSVFKHKIELENGVGQGDFFLPTSVTSGNYKLLGFTRWMKNGERDTFFQADLAVVNPYRGDQSTLLPDTGTESVDISIPVGTISTSGRTAKSNQNDDLELTASGRSFGKRQQVTLNLKNKNGNSGKGKYSVSVRRLDTINSPARPTAGNFANTSGPTRIDNPLFVPELRGELITGKIQATEGGLSVANKKVALSIPGDDYVFDVAGTNEAGVFYFTIQGEYSGENALVEVIGDDRGKYTISLDPLPSVDHSSLQYNNFYITPAMEELILERSVYNQIENSYYVVKPDTVRFALEREPFFKIEPQVYDLDAYNRFPTIRETFVEIIRSAWLTRNRNGEAVIQVRGLEGAMDYSFPPLLLVDGAMVQDHQTFIDFPANRVQSIGILRNNIFVGPHIFQGIITVETIEGDFHERIPAGKIHTAELEKVQPKKSYFHPRYSPEQRAEKNRIPDLRYQLLWQPDVELNDAQKTLTFYTSDIPGEYEIAVEGFTEAGNPVSLREVIRVQ